MSLAVEQLECREVPANLITGNVFEDFNYNGVQDLGPTITNASTGSIGLASDVGIGGVTVTVTGTNGFSSTVTTDNAGNYSINDAGGDATTMYRVQFTTLPAGFTDAPHGTTAPATDSRSSVRFITGNNATTTINFGVARGADYFASTAGGPTLISQRYQVGGAAGNNNPVILSFPYNSGTSSADGTVGNYLVNAPTTLATMAQVGATWGLATNARPTVPVVYTSAFMKSYSGFGPNGTGAIYTVNATGPNGVSLFADLNALFAPTLVAGAGTVTLTNGSAAVTGTGTTFTTLFVAGQSIQLNSAPGVYYRILSVNSDTSLTLTAAYTGTTASGAYSRPVFTAGDDLHTSTYADNTAVAWNAVGKTSLGGMALSEDGTRLYVMNLADRSLYALGVNPVTGAFTGTVYRQQIVLPGTGGVTGITAANPLGDLRAFAVQVLGGKVYIGAVNSAEAAGSTSADLRAYVFEVTDSGSALTFDADPAFEMALNYPRANVDGSTPAAWLPWTPTPTSLTPGGNGIYPQPILSGIAFDTAGNMTLGFRDRMGDQTTNGGPSTRGITGGDTIQVGYNAATKVWTAEVNGIVTEETTPFGGNVNRPVTHTGDTDDNFNRGIDDGKFYYQDIYDKNGNTSQAVSTGGVLQLPGFPSVIVTAFDPAVGVTGGAGYDGAGFSWYNRTDGHVEKAYTVYQQGGNPFFGKANGVGNVVALQPLAPVSIGNRVWLDTNGDGVQDAGEPGIAGVTVRLFAPDGVTLLATAVTDANGNYSFSSDTTRTSTTSDRFGVGLTHNTNGYVVTFDSTTVTDPELSGLVLTVDNRGGDDTLDSDATVVGGVARTTVNTGNPGSVDHSIDAGYYRPVSVGNFVWHDQNGNGIQDGGELGINGVNLTLTGTSAAGVTVTRTTTTAGVGAGAGAYLFDNLPPGTYTVTVDVTNPALAGYVATAQDRGGNDALDSDNPAGATTTPGTLASGGSDLTLDFGYYRPVSVGNFVWHDLNANGIQDSGEPGINGVTLTLTGTSAAGVSVTRTTTTAGVGAGAGAYLFDYLPPGTYTVTVDGSNFTAGGALVGYTATATGQGGDTALDSNVSPAGTTPAALTSGGSDLTLDFGYYRPVSVGNFVWHDQNGNGIQDGGEPGINGVRLTLTGTTGAGVTVTRTATTADLGAGDGGYLFDNLPPGTYTVSVDATNPALAGYLPTASNVGGNDAVDSDDPTGAATTPVALTSGASDLTLDFGYYRPVSVGNFVWNDQNGNGIQDTGEPGINGVTLTLTGTDGLGNPVIRTTTTANDGNTGLAGAYLFSGLLPGTYTVTVDATNFTGSGALAAFLPTATGAAGSTAANDSNPNPSGTTPAALPSGASDLTLDFGYVQGVSIGNFVWRDTNGNGLQDSGEPGIQGVVLRLTGTDAAGNSVDVTTTTDVNGQYTFTQRPGTYTVSVDAANFTGTGVLIGYTATAQNRGGNDSLDSDNPAGTATTPATLTAGGSDQTIDFGYYQPVSVGNFVWHDQNGNGVQDSGEPGINGVVVNLTGTDGAGNAVNLTATTTGNGGYLFNNLAPGTYTVTVDPANFNTGGALVGYTATATGRGGDPALDSNPSPSGTTPGTLPSGASDLTLDFGYYQPVSVGNFVWSDTNRDGVQDGGEPGINGVVVTLTGTDGLGNTVTRTTTTAGNGAYLFDNLVPGTYTVTVAASNFSTGGALRGYLASPTGAAGSTTANDSNGSPSGTTPGTLASGASDPDVDFGFYPTADLSLTKTVNRPTAAVGTQVVFTVTVRNDGPLAATGVTVLDQLPSGFSYVSDTGAGAYNSGTGVWTVGGLAVGATQTLQITATVVASGNYTNLAEIATSDQPDVDSTPGNGPQGTPEDDEASATVAPPSSIAGVVYLDSNRDGDRDPGEPGIAGVRVTLFNATTGAQVATTTTAANGSYLFSNLPPGTYRVVETQPPTYADGAETLGNAGGTVSANDTFSGIVLTPGTVATGYNFGEIRPGLSGTVFLDADKDGAFDTGETGIAGVRITLRNAAGTVVGVRTTDANGNYVFPNLAPGVYTITETQPAGFGNTPVGPYRSNVRTVRITNQFLTNQNFGETLGSLSGLVYVDANNDGVKQGAEAPISGATVRLINVANGAVVRTATTAPDGTYIFDNLRAGRYRIVETQPAGFSDGKDAVGTVGGTLVAPDTINNINLPAGGTGRNYNFGERPVNGLSGTVYLDRNQDSVYQPATDRPLAGIVVTLRDSGGTVVATTMTAADGSYNFTDLPAGTYTIEEAQPTGYGNSEVPSNVRTVTMPAAGFITNQNFGDTLSTISGRVYRDYNLNGVFNNTGANPDTGIAGVTVTLRDSGGTVVATTTTAANGTYSFTGLTPGTYTVTETQPPLPTNLFNGFYDGADNLGSLSGTQPTKNTMGVTVGIDGTTGLSQNGTNYNFGELPPADPNGFVYVDANRNGVRDPGERGIAGVAITISGTAFAGTAFARPITGADVPGGSLTVFTNANGFYQFNPIPPGLYTIRETQPVGYIDGRESNRDPSAPAPTVGNDVFSNIVLNPFPIRGPFDFGEFLPVSSTPSKRNLLGSAM